MNCYKCKYAKIGQVCWCKKKLKIITGPYITKCKDYKEKHRNDGKYP